LKTFLLNRQLAKWTADAFEALLILERNPSSQAALAGLDRIRREFDYAAPLIERLLDDASRRKQSVSKKSTLR